MTKVDYELQRSALDEAQKVAEQPFHDIINECKQQLAGISIKINELKIEGAKIKNRQHLAGIQCFEVRKEYSTMRCRLGQQYKEQCDEGNSSTEEAKVTA